MAPILERGRNPISLVRNEGATRKSRQARSLRIGPALKRHGLIDELDPVHLQGEKHTYELKTPREHVHMTGLGCGQVAEFETRPFDGVKKTGSKGLSLPDCRRTYGNRRILRLLSCLTTNRKAGAISKIRN
jgi:hypothetical protein